MGVKVSQDRGLPLFACPAQSGDLGDRAGRERGDHLADEFPAPFRPGVVDVAELLVALPGQADFVVRVPEAEFGIEPGGLFVGEVFDADPQGPADSVERLPLRPRCPRVSCCTRRRTSSTMADPSFTTWKASRMVMASGSSSRIAFA
nr:hypothetical protein [Arthrobacter sp. MA-N2]